MARQVSEETKALVRKAGEYQYIRVWGSVMGSYAYYVENEQQRAAEDHAPLDAIHYTYEYVDGRSAPSGYSDEQIQRLGIRKVWKTVQDLKNATTRWNFEKHCQRLKIDPPVWTD